MVEAKGYKSPKERKRLTGQFGRNQQQASPQAQEEGKMGQAQ